MADERHTDVDGYDDATTGGPEIFDEPRPEQERRKVASPLWYAVALGLAVLIILWFLLNGLTPIKPGSTDLTAQAPGNKVPDVVAMQVDEAKAKLTDAGYATEVQETVDRGIPEGTVISQMPLPGVRLVEGATVVLEVAIPETERMDTQSEHDPYPAVVPKLVGLGRAPAVNRIESRGYVPLVKEAYSATVGRGNVISQQPAAGVSAVPGTTVVITVSIGPSPAKSITVPDVDGLSRSAAQKRIEAAGLSYYEIPRPEPGSINRVFDQWPKAGERLEPGGEVQVLYGVNP